MTSPLSVVGFNDNLLLEEYCTRAYSSFPSTHQIMKDATIERAAFYEVVFVKLQEG